MRAGLPAWVAGLVIVLAACSGGGAASQSAIDTAVPPSAAAAPSEAASGPPVDLTILAAASLKGVLDKVKTAYEAANPGTRLTIATDSSAALETQIELGATADVFLSADTTNPRKLVGKGLADGAAVTFAGNKLAIIVPTTNPAGIKAPADLASPGVKVVAAGDAVPITKYATQLIGNLAKEAGYPSDFAARYAANIVSREDNVNAIVAKIELGEGDTGIVYLTDARASTSVTTIDVVPATANVLATYAGVVVKASKHAAAARALMSWFAGLDGQAILGSFGFLPPP